MIGGSYWSKQIKHSLVKHQLPYSGMFSKFKTRANLETFLWKQTETFEHFDVFMNNFSLVNTWKHHCGKKLLASYEAKVFSNKFNNIICFQSAKKCFLVCPLSENMFQERCALVCSMLYSKINKMFNYKK
jgi:hypothetical protein